MQGGDDKERLLEYLQSLAERSGAVPLGRRFEALASHWRIPGWRSDIEAFLRFKRMRDFLLHRGDTEISHRLTLGDEVRSLSDLVERYVSLAIFGHAQVYESRWRVERAPAEADDDS
jgi:hypothetical protein